MLILPSGNDNQRETVEEAGYLASASDLMIGILFVFIIMVVMLIQKVDAVQRGDKQESPLSSVVLIIGEKFKEAGLTVSIDPNSGVIGLPADTLFPSNSAVLTKDSQETLKKIARSLAQILPCYVYSERRNRSFNCPENNESAEIETIFFEGHTDSDPLQLGNYTNWHLALDRSRAVYDVLTEGKLQEYRNERKLDVFGISSYADKRTKKNMLNIEDKSMSRRVELRFVLAFKSDSQRSSAATKTINTITNAVPQ
jgi:outer membrane protein OmpA-like peptidoglycan-associated protein